MESVNLDHIEVVGAFRQLGLIIDEHDAELLVVHFLKRQGTSFDSLNLEIQVAVLCHQLALEGTPVVLSSIKAAHACQIFERGEAVCSVGLHFSTP